MIDLNILRKGFYLYYKDKDFIGRYLEPRSSKLILEGKSRALTVPTHFCDYVEINEKTLELLDYKKLPDSDNYYNSTDWIVSKTSLGWVIHFKKYDPALSGFPVKYIHDIQSFLEEFELPQDQTSVI